MNTAPVAVADFVTVDQFGSIEIFPLLNDYDDDGDTLTIYDYSYLGDSGNVYDGPNGGIFYEIDDWGSYPIEYIYYTLSDGNGGIADGTIEILINQPPDVTGFDQNTPENRTLPLTLYAFDDEDGIDLDIVFSGPDGALFEMHNDGVSAAFISPPDFESPLDANGDNVYDVTVTVTDSAGSSASDDFQIFVDDVDESGSTESDDAFSGSNDSDNVDLLGGNDRFFAKFGGDTVYGNDGSDTVFGDQGNDSLSGGNGNDKLVGGKGHDSIYGGAGNDILNGEAGDDFIQGGGDNDRIYGGQGDDTIDGEEGGDVIFGDGGNDYIFDTAGNNRLYGGDGNDYLATFDFSSDGQIVNTLRGGADSDTLVTDGGRARLFGDAGDDTLSSTDGNDLLVGGSGNDLLDADAGNDRLNGEAGSDTLDGGSGDDQMNGGTGDDTLNGRDGNDRMIGGDGHDVLFGEDGNDTMFGGEGDDYLVGGAGDDRLDAGGGYNYIDTGTGIDTIFLGHIDGAWNENDDFDFTQDKLIIDAFDGNTRTVVDSLEELYALDLDGLTVNDNGFHTYLEFQLDDGASHTFGFLELTQFDFG